MSIPFRPLGDRVVVRVIENEDQVVGGIIIPDTAQKKSTRAKVLAVGEGRYEDGIIVPLAVNLGDVVVFSEWGGTTVRIAEEDLLILREQDILGVEEGVKV